MHLTPVPFWLMIVSIATAVLPVCRSPMISSRCPRPIGTMESIALRPVCTGCDTDCRAITPGATFSITSVSFALIGPLPSIGAPSELTTRPSSSGPIGTERIFPVHFTVSPSVMCSYSPRITEPTESRSRLSARPNVFFGNSSISPCMTSERPWTRQIPSVTDTTVPCVRICAPASRFWIRLRISSEISDGLSCMACSLCLQCVLERAELRARRAVDDFVAEHDLDPGDQILVDADARLHLASRLLLEARDQVGELRVFQVERGVHLGLDYALALVPERFVLRADFGEHVEPAVFGEHAHQVLRVAGKLSGQHRDEQPRDLRGRQIGITDCNTDALVGGDRRDVRQHARPLGELALRIGELEHCLRVWTCNRAGFSHAR